MGKTLTVGAAAASLGIESHVLRHWEDVGVLVPPRNAAGHRRYDDELLGRARLIQLCQRAGLSLAQIRSLHAADRDERITMISATLQSIRQAKSELERADGFLSHVASCVHPIISECPECSAFAEQQSHLLPKGFGATCYVRD